MTGLEVFLLVCVLGMGYLLMRTFRRPVLCSHCRELAIGHFTINGVRSNYCEDHESLYIQGKPRRKRLM